MSRQKQYWGFRVDVNNPTVYPDYYNAELEQERLRQGWGWDESCNLKHLTWDSVPRELRANFRMYDEVKKGDTILIPRIPKWEMVTIAEATEDWATGYHFKIDSGKEDFGHQFPAKYISHFNRHNQHVAGDIRSTLHARQRFWNMSWCATPIDNLLCGSAPEDLIGHQKHEARFTNALEEVMSTINKSIGEGVHAKLSERLNGNEWEYALVAGLKALFPHYQVDHTGGRDENKHGTDILVTIPGIIPGILDGHSDYGIAIQIKDWQGVADASVAVEQLKRADDGWKEQGLRIIEKIVVVTEAKRPKGFKPKEILEKHGVIVLHSDSLKILLRRMALVTAAAMDE